MNTDTLRKEFDSMLEMEKRAKYSYDHYIDQVDDEAIKQKLTEIRDDEIMHIKIVERLIEIVS